jgi:hypothetical protein
MDNNDHQWEMVVSMINDGGGLMGYWLLVTKLGDLWVLGLLVYVVND